MPAEQVQCSRKLDAAPDDVWAVLRGFDIGWHPMVASCTLLRGRAGAVTRAFTTTDGGQMVEQRSYLSDTDRVLRYTALSGIEGAFGYAASVEVTGKNGTSTVTWQANITARADRVAQIADGTRAVFEAGLDQLGHDLPPAPPSKQAKRRPTATKRMTFGTPRLSLLTTSADHAASDTLVLFLHGIGGQATNWADQIAAFGAGYRVAAMDLRGYGDSARGPTQTQVSDYCADILAAAKQVGTKRVVLVGLSMGSWIATSFAMRHGDMLAGLVLAGGCTGMSEADPQERDAFRAARELPLSQGQSPADFAASVVDIIAGPQASKAQHDILHASMAAIPSDTYRDALTCFCNPPETFDFAKISCPVLMVTGEHDRLAPPAEIRAVSRRIFSDLAATGGHPDIRFEVLAGAGHLCNLEQPAAFNDVLAQFLERLPHVGSAFKPTRAEKQHEKRARILQAAHAEFCEAGFDGASMDRLAKAADVSKPTLYQYFGDKDGLFAAVLEEGRAHIIAPLVGGDGTLVDRLWRFSWTYARFVLRPDMLSLARLILGEAGRRPQSAVQYHQSGPARAFDGLVEFVSAADAAGELDIDDPKRAANDLWSLILSGPRDHYLHHVADRPTEAELLAAIGHGLGVFLKAYSRNPSEDRQALSDKMHAAQSRLDRAPKDAG